MQVLAKPLANFHSRLSNLLGLISEREYRFLNYLDWSKRLFEYVENTHPDQILRLSKLFPSTKNLKSEIEIYKNDLEAEFEFKNKRNSLVICHGDLHKENVYRTSKKDDDYCFLDFDLVCIGPW